MFTPTNMMRKWIFAQVELRVKPVNRGNQCTNPPIIANTAPMERT